MAANVGKDGVRGLMRKFNNEPAVYPLMVCSLIYHIINLE